MQSLNRTLQTYFKIHPWKVSAMWKWRRTVQGISREHATFDASGSNQIEKHASTNDFSVKKKKGRKNPQTGRASRWMERRACPSSGTRTSPTEEERRGSLRPWDDNEPKRNNRKHGLPPTRSFVHRHCRCCCCCLLPCSLSALPQRTIFATGLRQKGQICPRDHPTLATMGDAF